MILLYIVYRVALNLLNNSITVLEYKLMNTGLLQTVGDRELQNPEHRL